LKAKTYRFKDRIKIHYTIAFIICPAINIPTYTEIKMFRGISESTIKEIFGERNGSGGIVVFRAVLVQLTGTFSFG